MNTEKLLKNAIKIAAVALTSPATWVVAGQLYDNPFQRIVVQLAALILVEGALMLGWWQLDNDRKAETPQRVLYAVLSSVAYIALWAVAIAHGEGASGITFRLTLGVLLGYSVFESGILAGIKLRRSADKDISALTVVKRYRRKRATEHARREIDAEFGISRAKLEVETEVAHQTVRLSRERQLKGLMLDHERSLEKLEKRNGSISVPGPAALHPAAELDDLEDELDFDLEESEDVSYREEELRDLIIEAFAKDPKYVRAHLAKELNISKNKLSRIINDLLDEGILDRRGQRLNVVRSLEAVSGNGRRY